MKKTLIKLLYGIIVFIVSVILIGHFTSRTRTDMTAAMQEASLPVVSLRADGETINPLRGYTQAIDVKTMRGTICALPSARSLEAEVMLYGVRANALSFEVRSIDGENLIEQTEITDVRADSGADRLSASFALKDLIDTDTEYMLVIVINTDLHGDVRYYTRVIVPSDGNRYNQREKVQFVKDFHEGTFAKNEELSTYIESRADGENYSFTHSDIHSSFARLTWEGLEIEAHTAPSVYISDLHEETASIRLDYVIAIKDGESGRVRNYRAREDYRIRYTASRTYLIDYHRHLNMIFTAEAEDITEGVISLSYSDPSLTLTENETGSAFAFVNENRLFLYRLADNRLACVFGFYDAEAPDERTMGGGTDIRVLKIDEGGSLRFLVCGYMSRGRHEGEVGTAIYDYDASLNTIEERVFFPDTRSEEVVRASMRKLANVNASDVFFAVMGSGLHAVNLIDRTDDILEENILSCEMQSSASGDLLAWQGKDANDRPSDIRLLNLNTRAIETITAEEGEYVRLLGFMGEDLIYGMAREADIRRDGVGDETLGMYRLRIRSREGELLNEYNAGETPVHSIEVAGNQIILHRMILYGDGTFTMTTDDHIMSSMPQQTVRNRVTTVDTADGGVTQIVMRDALSGEGMRYLTPGETVYTDDRTVVTTASSTEKLYYAWTGTEVIGIYPVAGDALNAAYEYYGVATDDRNRYIFYRGNLLTRNQNMSLTNSVQDREFYSISAMRACIEAALTYEGASTDRVAELLDEGKGLTEVLEECLPDKQILNLDGCPLQAMLYYANRDIPVFATLNDGRCVLVIGFNELNTVLFDPAKGTETVYKYGMKDSTKLFAESGNHFVAYVDR